MFRFRLQRVLELREQKEKTQAKVLAEAEQLAAAAREKQQELQELHTTSALNLSAAHASDPTVGHLNHLGFVLGVLDARLHQAAEVVAKAEETAAEARSLLDLAARDRRVLDRLKDKHEDAHRVEEGQRDRVLMDDVALGRFTRARSKPNGGVTEG